MVPFEWLKLTSRTLYSRPNLMNWQYSPLQMATKWRTESSLDISSNTLSSFTHEVLQNLRTTSGRSIKLSQKGQDAIETFKPRLTRHQIHKQARRHAHALRLERAKLGHKRASDAEIKSLKEKGTFELVDYPEGKQVLPLKWIFTYKLDDAGYLIRHKARICVRGDLQHHSGEDIYAATGAYRSFRILMALERSGDCSKRSTVCVSHQSSGSMSLHRFLKI
ncbi:hypothetical protein HZ326_31720, partial [Fusarium oxysporum f. sp. albedinis]